MLVRMDNNKKSWCKILKKYPFLKSDYHKVDLLNSFEYEINSIFDNLTKHITQSSIKKYASAIYIRIDSFKFELEIHSTRVLFRELNRIIEEECKFGKYCELKLSSVISKVNNFINSKLHLFKEEMTYYIIDLKDDLYNSDEIIDIYSPDLKGAIINYIKIELEAKNV